MERAILQESAMKSERANFGESTKKLERQNYNPRTGGREDGKI